MFYVYLFEARGIQRYLFATGKLRDMLGGSELIDFICADNGYLDIVVKALGLGPRAVRRAGGVFYLVFESEEQAVRLQSTWRIASRRWLPGVERVDALASGTGIRDAMHKGFETLRIARNRIEADLPRPGPLSERSPRTGLAAVTHDGEESLDAATYVQRQFTRPSETGSLADRFLDDSDVSWPKSFEDDKNIRKRDLFPLRKTRMVGLIHADGNGLGMLLRILNEACSEANDDTYVTLYRNFSDYLTEATQAAAHEATEETLLPEAIENRVMPARPLVLGGDDMSIIVRDDLALPFAKAFLKAFEAHTAEAMTRLKHAFHDHGLNDDDLPSNLTACAGIVYMKCSQPFHGAHDLAEQLCGRAKKVSRQHMQSGAMISSLAFHKLQDSMMTDPDELYARTQRIDDGEGSEDRHWHLALDAYSVRPHESLPCVDDLQALANILLQSEMNDRPLRNLATLLHSNLDEASQAYRRWREVSARRDAAQLEEFDKTLGTLVGTVEERLPFAIREDGDAHSPLADLLTLLSLADGPRKH